MKQFLLLIGIIISLVECRTSKNTSNIITVNELKQIISEKKQIQLIDVRTPNEYKKGTIKGALNINLRNSEVFNTEVQKLNKQDPVYIFCQKGGRSKKASKILAKMGFAKIYDYSGGYSEWEFLNN